MAERFIKLYNLPRNLYSEDSPVILAAGSLLRDTITGEIVAQLKIQNIGPKAIKAVTVALSARDTAGRPLGTPISHRYLDLNVWRNQFFGFQTPIVMPDSATRAFHVGVTEVIFANGSVWTASDAPWETLAEQPRLQNILGDDELVKQYGLEVKSTDCFAPTEYKDLWYCTCGKINRSKEESCHYCNKEKAKLFAALDTASLRESANQRLTEEKAEAEAQAKKIKKFLAIALPVAVVCIAFLFVLTSVIIPNSKYNTAVALMETGEYEDAVAVFEAMEGYKDSTEKIEECNYRKASELMENGEYEEAITAFESLDSYKDSAEQIEICETAIVDEKYSAAVEMMDSGEYEDAIEAFEALDGYNDIAEQIEACETAILDIANDAAYNEALSFIDQGDIISAYEAFAALNGYKDSTSQAEDIYEQYKAEKLSSISVGDFLLFGSYEQDNNPSNGKEKIWWQVLAKEDNNILVISKYALDCHEYHVSYHDVTWENCSLRSWLNDDFFNSTFSTNEQSIIPKVTISADINPEYSTDPGNDTVDQIFLLSIDDIEQYFTSDKERKCIPTDYAIANGVYVNGDNDNCCWWLRSPGFYQGLTVKVRVDGSILYYGNPNSDDDVGVRPAMWIRLDED